MTNSALSSFVIPHFPFALALGSLRACASLRRLKNTDSIFVAGHRGLAGGAIFRELQMAGYTNLLTRTRAEVDLKQRDAVRAFFSEQRPQVVVVAAAKVGGIKANNDFPVEFLLE